MRTLGIEEIWVSASDILDGLVAALRPDASGSGT
jgi:hypothetical protein